jgi:hypothetical protein
LCTWYIEMIRRQKDWDAEAQRSPDVFYVPVKYPQTTGSWWSGLGSQFSFYLLPLCFRNRQLRLPNNIWTPKGIMA